MTTLRTCTRLVGYVDVHVMLIVGGDARFPVFFFFSSRRRHTRFDCDWSSDVCSSDLGRPDREKTCECERTAEPNVAQMLHIANGDTLNEKLVAKDNQIAKLIADKTPPEKMVEEAYLGSLSRFPTTAEKKKILQVLEDTKEGDQRPLIEDLYWALLSSKEFLFNH